jgi:hypothetical protein
MLGSEIYGVACLDIGHNGAIRRVVNVCDEFPTVPVLHYDSPRMCFPERFLYDYTLTVVVGA